MMLEGILDRSDGGRMGKESLPLRHEEAVVEVPAHSSVTELNFDVDTHVGCDERFRELLSSSKVVTVDAESLNSCSEVCTESFVGTSTEETIVRRIHMLIYSLLHRLWQNRNTRRTEILDI
jgi:hypothetical protein